MSWTITAPAGPQVDVSYGSVRTLADELADVLPARKWRHLRAVFGPRSGDPFDVQPKAALEVAVLLRQAVVTGRMSSASADLALDLAASATTSSIGRTAWRWS